MGAKHLRLVSDSRRYGQHIKFLSQILQVDKTHFM